VARITYVSEESQYVVARLEVSGKADDVTIVGTVLRLTPGETLRVHGHRSHHPKYGEQFQIERSGEPGPTRSSSKAMWPLRPRCSTRCARPSASSGGSTACGYAHGPGHRHSGR
jgi:hypothetical protein